MREASEAVGMTMGMPKCGRASTGRRGSEGHSIDTQEIRVLRPDEAYKYLGLEQRIGLREGLVKKRLMEELCHRLTLIWNSDLTAKQKVEATNTWAMSLYHYYLPIMEWRERELLLLDRLVRRIMRKRKAHYFNSSAERCHVPRKQGGRGVHSFIDLSQRTAFQTVQYLLKVERHDSLMESVLLHQRALGRGGGWSLYGYAQKVAEKFEVDLDAPMTILEDAQNCQRKERLKRKKVHGAYWKELAKPTRQVEGCCAWLTHLALPANVESTIVAIQDGSIVTRNYRRKIFHIRETGLFVCHMHDCIQFGCHTHGA